MMTAHKVTAQFEAALCEYTGARFAVAVNSCTMALLLAVRWQVQLWQIKNEGAPCRVCIPKRTYVGVPMSIIHAGARVMFREEDWLGSYRLEPFPIWDSARRFTGGMYESGQMQCVSFHTTKILGDTQGGAILHDDPVADKWLRKARFDGRREGVAPIDDTFNELGWHCYISPDVSARLWWKLGAMPKDRPDLPNDNYPDLSTHALFKRYA
jgi:dTDP-4-amino-4,6-dideoxygalactose transaminase